MGSLGCGTGVGVGAAAGVDVAVAVGCGVAVEKVSLADQEGVGRRIVGVVNGVDVREVPDVLDVEGFVVKISAVGEGVGVNDSVGVGREGAGVIVGNSFWVDT